MASETMTSADRAEVIASMRPYIHKRARKLCPNPKAHGIDLADLEHEAIVAVLESLKRWDEGREVKLTTYLGYRVDGAIRDFFRRERYGSRLHHRRSEEVMEFQVAFKETHGRAASEEEVCQTLGIKLSSLRRTMRHQCTAGSLVRLNDLVTHHEGKMEQVERLDMVPSPETGIEEETAQQETALAMIRLVAMSSDQDRTILQRMYFRREPVRTVAEDMRLTERQVHVLHRRAISNLREHALDEGLLFAGR